MGLGTAGLQLDRAAETGNRPVPMPRPAVRLTQIAVILGHGGVDRDRAADQVDRRGRVARLAGQGAQQMERIGMIGKLGQDLAIDPFRLGQSTGLVMPDGDPHRLIDRQLDPPCGKARNPKARNPRGSRNPKRKQRQRSVKELRNWFSTACGSRASRGCLGS